MSEPDAPHSVQPSVEVVDPPVAGGVEVIDAPDGVDGQEDREAVTRPSKLIRIASMVKMMLEEVRQAPLDEAGRRRLRQIHEKSLSELESILSPDLREELCEVVLPFTEAAPSESELRIAQAQLVGWLEGLFHGIQATLFSQQVAAQAQMEQMRRRALPGAGPHPGLPGGGPRPGSTGYL